MPTVAEKRKTAHLAPPSWTPKDEAMWMQVSIGARVDWLLKFRQVTQTAVAKAIGVTQPAISNIITDDTRQPSASTLMKIAVELNCNPQWILDGKGDPFHQVRAVGPDEIELIQLFKLLDAQAQQSMLAVARALAR